jgi:hypothetical protein
MYEEELSENYYRGLKEKENYYQGLKEKIKNTYAQLFVTQLKRKDEVHSVFSMILLWMRREIWSMYSGMMLQVETTTNILVTWFLLIPHIAQISTI